MGRVNDDNWLDEALNEAIHSADTQPDFEKWKAEHPEAVEMLTSRTPMQRPLRIRRIIMNATFVKLAAAAVIALAGIIGITQLTRDNPQGTTPTDPTVAQETITGPTTHTFADGSTVQLAPGAGIRTFADAGKRGFEHLAGQIDVTVAKGKGEFIVTSPYGQVKALGTQFTMNLVDDTDAQTKEPVRLLAVEVVEGTVEVRNAKGIQTLHEKQNAVVSLDSAPYGYSQDEGLPEGLRTRIAAMVAAFGTGDRAAWAENFNLGYIYKLGKGEVKYDPNLFGGSAEDAENLKKMLAQVNSLDQMKQMFLESINITEPIEVYVRAVELSADGTHARAECVRHKGNRHTVITRPQWHYFDGGWWQVDD
jgi:hypothetical protein